MDYVHLPTVLSTVPVDIVTPTGRLLSSIDVGRRAVIIVNRGNSAVYLGDNVGVGESSGFLLLPGDAVVLATASEVWITTGTVHLLTLAQ